MADYDVAVIGAGVAGLNAAVTTARYGLKTVVIEMLGAGGQVINVDRIENYPGPAEGMAGFELGPNLQMQADEAGAEFILDQVEQVEKVDEGFAVIGSDTPLTAKTLIVAAGSARRKLGIAGEDVYEGRGVSHCASCDGPLLRGKDVSVVGGGDSALDEALSLSAHANRVTIIHRGTSPTARRSLVERCIAAENISFMDDADVEAILGDDGVTHLRVRRHGESVDVPCHAVFVYVGLEPASAFLGDLVARDEAGRIKVDLMMRSSMDGIFAAGDIRQDSVAHLAASAGDGVTAALAAVRFLGERG